MSNYETFASIYDQVMDQNLYEKWLNWTTNYLRPQTRSILDLACGTGQLTTMLAKAGFEVTGLDLSAEMLSLALNRTQKEQVKINLIEQNLLDLSELGRTFDAVTCFSDSLCYLNNATELKQAFAEVYQILNDNGTFLFDVHSTYQIDQVFPNYSYHENAEDFAFLWDSFADVAPHSIVHELTFFIRDHDRNHFLRFDEVHQERTYELNQYLTMLKEVGFNEVQVVADFTDQKPQANSKRWFFIANKGK